MTERSSRDLQDLMRIAPPPPPVPGIPLSPAALLAGTGGEAAEATAGFARGVLLGIAGFLVAAAVFFPIWELRLLLPDGADGLRLLVYPGRIAGHIEEINTINRAVGRADIVPSFVSELRIIPALLGLAAAACFIAVFLRHRWAAALPLALLAATAAYGVRGLLERLGQFGGAADPAAAVRLEPFRPAVFGAQQLGDLATYAYFSWGTLLPAVAAVLLGVVVWLDLRGRSA
jgi:copper chaperone NosL